MMVNKLIEIKKSSQLIISKQILLFKILINNRSQTVFYFSKNIFEMPFQLWGYTLMGIPQMANLPPYYILSNRYFLLSLLLQIVLLFLFSYVIIFSFYRAIKKITNPYVYQSIEIQEQIIDKDKENAPGQNVKQTEQDRIRRKKNGALIEQKNNTKNFEDEGEQGQDKLESENDEQSQESDEGESQDDDDKSDKSSDSDKQIPKNESEEEIAAKIKLFFYQESLLKLAPWCFVFIFTMNHFTIDYISIVTMLLTIVSYLVFNIFNVAAAYPMLKNLFMVGVFAGFVPHFINNQDFTN